MMYLLNIYYKEVSIDYLETNRYSNLKIIITAKYFKGINKKDLTILKNICTNISEIEKNPKKNNLLISIFDNNIDKFINELIKYLIEILKDKTEHFKNKYNFLNNINNLSDKIKKKYLTLLFQEQLEFFYNFIAEFNVPESTNIKQNIKQIINK